MRQQGGMLLIVGAITALWLYNTGRIMAVWQVLKTGSIAGLPGSVGVATPTGIRPIGGGTNPATDPSTIAMCAAINSEGVVDPQCITQIWKGWNSPEDIVSSGKTLLDSVFGFTGIQF